MSTKTKSQSASSNHEADKKTPVESWALGRCQAAVWIHQDRDEQGEALSRPLMNVTFGKRIRTEDGGWQTVRTLFPEDIPQMIVLLQQAQAFVLKNDIPF